MTARLSYEKIQRDHSQRSIVLRRRAAAADRTVHLNLIRSIRPACLRLPYALPSHPARARFFSRLHAMICHTSRPDNGIAVAANSPRARATSAISARHSNEVRRRHRIPPASDFRYRRRIPQPWRTAPPSQERDPSFVSIPDQASLPPPAALRRSTKPQYFATTGPPNL
jgi:hypothetical protein